MASLRSTSKRAGQRHNNIRTAGGALRAPTDENIETRIGRDIQPQPNGCWLWKGRGDDYGVTTVRGRLMRIHRFVYQTFNGPIPEGHHIHHECLSPGCCNPAHLIALTPAEHGARHSEMRRAS